MSPRTPIITLNLGSQSIELAQFHTQGRGRLILAGYQSRELVPASEEMRAAQIVAALREMMRDLRIRGGNVIYTVAEEMVFSRFVRLPAIEEEKIERIIFFEAQQNVPFPLDEVVWDYQIVGGGAEEQIEVVLAAVKADWLEKTNSAVEETGLRPCIVDLATMALYNAFCYNYRELSGCSLLIDIGARTTNLLFIEPGRIFTRSVPIGGSSITATIAREFNEPFAAAEFRKKRDGALNLADGLDADVARVTKIVRHTMTRLHAEVMRSVSHYCTQQQGNVPERAFLSGGGASTAHIQEFFQEKLRHPVEFFNPLRNVAIEDLPDAEAILQSAHLLGEPVGLALRMVTSCPMQLNIRPARVERRKRLEEKRPFFIATAACLLLGLFGWGAYYAHAAQIIRRRTGEVESKVAVMQQTERQLNRVRQQTAMLDKVATPLIAAINDRSFWPLLLEDLNARLPKEDIWITELVPTSAGKPLNAPESRTALAGATAAAPAIDGLLVRGLYLSNPKQQEVVVDYFRNLVDSPWFAIDPKNQAKYLKPTTPTNTEWAFPYELRLDLKTPVSLP
ncbi:MAG: type IV pilus assembly protein PilM [Verrucomicrobiota bacterium]|nr:type IV pilus assembly protein PilM [Verrucomicrobiota bacterium]